MKVAARTAEQENNVTPPGPLRIKGWQLDGLALLLFTVLTVLMTWPVTPNMGRSLEQWGDALLQTWTLDWNVHALLTNPLNWAGANSFYPYSNTLAFSETLIGQALLVAPVIWLTGNPVLGYNLLLLGSFVLCGWGTYLLTRDLTGSRLAGIIAGTIFAFFPHRFGQLSHLHLLAAQWMPFCLLYLRRFIAPAPASRPPASPGEGGRWRDGIGFGLFLGLELLSSTYLGLFLVAATGLYLLYHLARWLITTRPWQTLARFRLDRVYKNKAARLFVILLVTALVVLPFYWPYLQVQQDLGFERSASEVQSFSAQPFYYLDVPKENRLNQFLYRPIFKQNWWEGSAGGERGLYLGLGAIILALTGLVAAWRHRRREPDGLFFGGLALVAISFTFGPYWQTGRFGALPLPYALLYNYVPGFGAIRVPVRFIYVVALAVAVLAGWGALWLQQRLHRQGRTGRALAAVGLVALLCGEYWSDVNLQNSDVLRQPAPEAARWLDQRPYPALFVPLSGSDNSDLFLQYWTRASWRPVMNGFSGFMPPAYDALKTTVAREGFSPRIIQLLQGLEVRYVVVETDHPSVAPQWSRWRADLQKSAAEAVSFGRTVIYELPPDPWLTRLKEAGVNPDSTFYWVDYRRSNPPLLELAATYLDRTATARRANFYGPVSIGFRPLPASLPGGKAPDFLAIASGEDPSLYGFRAADRVFGNRLMEVYRKSAAMLARYDFGDRAGLGEFNQGRPLEIKPGPNGLEFGAAARATPAVSGRYVSLGLAALRPQTLTVQPAGGSPYRLELSPGLSTYRVPLEAGLSLKEGEFTLVWAELWQGDTPPGEQATLRQDVVLLSAGAEYDEKSSSGTAAVQVVAPGTGPGDYTATLDVYNAPWGSHPNGHYGYWSLPLEQSGPADLRWRLDLLRKQMATTVNGTPRPNFPPDPRDLDLTRYGNFGDFWVTFNLYAGETLVGSARLFDFAVWAQGDKNKLENRRAGGFKGYRTALSFLVLPPGSTR